MHDTRNNRLEQEIVVFLPYPELEMFSFDKQGSLREKSGIWQPFQKHKLTDDSLHVPTALKYPECFMSIS